MTQAEFLLFIVQIWGVIGALVAVGFLAFGIDQIDEDARGAYVFRPLLVPGILLIWPLVLWRWWILADGRDEWAGRFRPRRNTHYWVGIVMPLALLAIMLTGLSVRQIWPVDIGPVQIAPPASEAQQ